MSWQHYRVAEGAFLRGVNRSGNHQSGSRLLESVDWIRNNEREVTFEALCRGFELRQRLLFYVGEAINTTDLTGVLERGFPDGPIPLSEMPPIPHGYGTGIILCRVITGPNDVQEGSRITV